MSPKDPLPSSFLTERTETRSFRLPGGAGRARIRAAAALTSFSVTMPAIPSDAGMMDASGEGMVVAHVRRTRRPDR